MINNVMAKYADIKKGLFDTQYEISGKPPTQNGNTTEEPRQAISLIDLDDAPAPSSIGSDSPVSSKTNVMNDLSDIFGSSASISTPPLQQQQQQKTTNDIFDLLGSVPSSAPINTNPPSSSSFGIASPSLHNTNAPQPRQTPSPVLYNNNQVNSKPETGTSCIKYIYIKNVMLIVYSSYFGEQEWFTN